MNITERVKRILLSPKEEWPVIAGETASIPELYRNYVFILAAIGPVASFIGMSLFGINLPMGGAIKIPIVRGIASAVVHYGLSLAAVYVLALIIDALAPTFSGEKHIGQAFKLAAYASTPGWLAAVFALLPSLAFLGILGLYGLYLLYLGLPVLMKSPQEKSVPYTVAVTVAAIVIFFVIGAVSRLFMP